jgi:hypothetical protein
MSQAGSIFLQSGGSTFVGSVLVKTGITCVAHGTEFGANPITLGESGQGVARLCLEVRYPFQCQTTLPGCGQRRHAYSGFAWNFKLFNIYRYDYSQRG